MLAVSRTMTRSRGQQQLAWNMSASAKAGRLSDPSSGEGAQDAFFVLTAAWTLGTIERMPSASTRPSGGAGHPGAAQDACQGLKSAHALDPGARTF